MQAGPQYSIRRVTTRLVLLLVAAAGTSSPLPAQPRPEDGTAAAEVLQLARDQERAAAMAPQGTSVNDGSVTELPPPPRHAHAGAYDASRDRVLSFGGRNGLSILNTVWSLSLSSGEAWTPFATTSTPPAIRQSASVIYDPIRDRLIVFGGLGSTYLNDVWELSLAGTPTWTRLFPTGTAPTGRYFATAIYDPVRDRMIVFGGQTSLAASNETWALSLSGAPAWSAIGTGTPPSARYAHVAAYDPNRDDMLVHGGFSGAHLADTYRLDLGSGVWSQVTTTGSAPARSEHGAVFDPVRDRLVLFAGAGPNGGDVRALGLTLSAWSVVTPSGTAPSPRSGYLMTLDPSRRRALIHGGRTTSTESDLWSLSLDAPEAWALLPVAGVRPTARAAHVALRDVARNRMVIFGGNGTSRTNDLRTLALAGTAVWDSLTPVGTRPPPRRDHSAAMLTTPDQLWIHGGNMGASRLSDLWSYDFSTAAWSALGQDGLSTPGLREGASMIYDAPGNRVVMFGGIGAGGVAVNALHYAAHHPSTATWQTAAGGTAPSARDHHSAIFDPVNRRMIVFGGRNGGTLYGDVWSLLLATDPPQWTPLLPSGTPPSGRYAHTAVYDPFSQRMLVTGGQTSLGANGETWALSLSGVPVWSRLTPQPNDLEARAGHVAVFDSLSDRMIVHGGVNSNSAFALNFNRATASITPAILFPAAGAAVNADPVPMTWNATVVGAPPESAQFRHRVDETPFSGWSYNTSATQAGLVEGGHALEVQARVFGSPPVSAFRTFSVDRTAPTTTLVQATPSTALTTDNHRTFVMSGTDNLATTSQLRYEYRIDGGPWVLAATSTFLVVVSEGPHLVEIRARDTAGNVDATPVVHSFTVDRTAPVITYSQRPADAPTVTTGPVVFEWTASDEDHPDPISFIYGVEGQIPATFTQAHRVTLDALPDGDHLFWVYTTDAAGNFASATVYFTTGPPVAAADSLDWIGWQNPCVAADPDTGSFFSRDAWAAMARADSLDVVRFGGSDPTQNPHVLHFGGFARATPGCLLDMYAWPGNAVVSAATFARQSWVLDFAPASTTALLVPPADSGSFRARTRCDVGAHGAPTSLVVRNGRFETPEFNVGNGSHGLGGNLGAADSAAVTMLDVHDSWIGLARIGYDGSRGSLTIGPRAHVRFGPDQDLFIGSNVHPFAGQANPASGTVVVDGLGSTLYSDGADADVRVGYGFGNRARLLLANQGTLSTLGEVVVGEGGNGEVDVVSGAAGSAARLYVGRGQGDRAFLRVSGPGSVWTGYELHVAGAFGGGDVRIEDGGAVAVGDAWIGAGAADSGRVTVTGAGSVLQASNGIRVGNAGRGILALEDQGVARAATLDVLAPGVLRGDGTVEGSLSNHSRVTPGRPLGALTVAGNYTQGAAGRLEIQIGGAVDGQLDRLLVAGGIATLDGTLEIARVDGFEPAFNQSFTVLAAAGGVSGAFDSVETHGDAWVVSYSASEVRITYLPREFAIFTPAAGAHIASDPIVFSWGQPGRPALEGGVTYASRLLPFAFGPPGTDTTRTLFEVPQGVHTFQVLAFEPGASTPDTLGRTFTVDRTPPTVTLQGGPADSAHVANTTASLLAVGADALTPVSALEFEVTRDAGPPAPWTTTAAIELSGLAAGPHTVSVRARDLAGNTGAAASRSWVVDLTPPVTTILSPAAGDTVAASHLFRWRASDDFATTAVLGYARRIDGDPFTPVVIGDSTATFALSEGPHVLEVVAQDRAGNLEWPPAQRAFYFDGTGPQVAFVAPTPAAQACVEQPWTVAVAAFDGLTPAGEIEYAWSVDGGAYGPFGRDTSMALSALTPGAWHTVAVMARDRVGNTGHASRDFFVVGASLPVTDVVAGPADSAHVGDEDADIAGVQVSFALANLGPDVAWAFRVNGLPWSEFILPSSFTLTLGEGPNQVEFLARDCAGRVETTPVGRAFIVDATAPETEVHFGPATGDTVPTLPITFRFRGADSITPGPSLRYSWSVDAGGSTAPATDTVAVLGDLGDGPHTFRVRAIDLAFNADTTPASRTFMVDRLGPQVTLNVPPEYCVASDSARFTWSGTDAVTAPGDIEFRYRLDGGPLSAPATSGAVSLTGLSEGLHSFELFATDRAGHTTPVSQPFRIDLTAPQVFAPTARVIDAGRIRVICTGADAVGLTGFRVQIADDPSFAQPLSEQTIGASGVLEFPAAPGSYYARAAALDCAGRQSPFSPPSNGATLAPLPNLVVTAVAAPPVAASGQPLQLSWTVADSASGSTHAVTWQDEVFLSPTPWYDPLTAVSLARSDNVSALAYGEGYTATGTVTLPRGAAGRLFLLVRTDTDDAQPETDGNDNVGASDTVEVALSAHADLEAVAVGNDAFTAFAGGSFEVRWTVRNGGSGRTDTDSWWDTVFLSPDSLFDFTLPSDGTIRILETPLGSRMHVGALEDSASYDDSLQVSLAPGLPGGRYWLYVYSDLHATGFAQTLAIAGSVFENQGEVNIGAFDTLRVVGRAPANLRVTQVATSGVAVSGQPLSVSWRVGNSGLNDTYASDWTDRVTLSADSVLDGGDIVLGAVPHHGGLERDSSYSAGGSFVLPSFIGGPRRVFVTTDASFHEAELSESDNHRVAPNPLHVQLESWPNLVVLQADAPPSAAAGGPLTVTWSVGNEGAAGASGSWVDQVFLSPSPSWSGGAGAMSIVVAPGASPLSPQAAYSRSATPTLDPSLDGTYYLYVVTDRAGQVAEHVDEGDNVHALGAIAITPHPPVDLAVDEVVAPAGGASGQPLAASWRVRNLGAARTWSGSWTDEVWLSVDATIGAGDLLLGTRVRAGALEPAAAYTGSLSATIPNGFSGTYRLLVRCARGAATGDGNAVNDVAAAPAAVAIALTAAPNLSARDVVLPPQVTSGQPMSVRWLERNDGPGVTLPAAWQTALYLSQDPWLDGGDFELGRRTLDGGLASGASRAESLDVEFPSWAAGPYYVIVRSDDRAAVHEGGLDGDNAGFAATLAVLAPPADLEVRDVAVQPLAEPGEPITVTWTLANVGVHPAVGVIRDGVYLSADDQFQPDDLAIGFQTRVIQLPPGGSLRVESRVPLARVLAADLTGNITAELPAVDPGSYRAIVRTNIRNNVREFVTLNNAAASAAPVQVDVAPLTIGVPVTVPMVAGQSRYWKVAVPAGQDLAARVTADQPSATNALYLALGRTPSPGDFDVTGAAEFTAHPRLTVPSGAGGTYFVLVQARALPSGVTVENVTVRVDALPFSIAAVQPAAGGQGRVTTVVTGAAFLPGTLVRLERDATVVAVGRVLERRNSQHLRVRWELGAVAPGPCDLVAAVGDSTAVLPNGFMVEPARREPAVTEVVQPDAVRNTSVGWFSFGWRNPGNVDIDFLRTRLVWPASSEVVAITSSDRLEKPSDLDPAVPPLAGDHFVMAPPAGGLALDVADFLTSGLAPGERVQATVGLRGFATTPYSVRSLDESMDAATYFARLIGGHERARLAALAMPQGLEAGLLELAGDPFAFRDAALEGEVATGVVDPILLAEFMRSVVPGLLGDALTSLPAGPLELLGSSEACDQPAADPECSSGAASIPTSLPGCRLQFAAPQPWRLHVPATIAVALPGGVTEGLTGTASADVEVLASCDPNQILGPAGIGDRRWVPRNQSLFYTVYFENVSSSTAPARRVRVTVPLDADLDVSSFRLGVFGIGTEYQNDVLDGLPQASPGVFSNGSAFIKLSAGLDLAAREAFWDFVTTDANGNPDNVPVTGGFLPVNEGTGSGTGFVTFTVRARDDVPSGTRVVERAAIVFDGNRTVPTDSTFNDVDSAAPVSGVQSAVPLDPTTVQVQWTGSDEASGAGIERFELYVRRDVGPFTLFRSDLAGTSAIVPLEAGHRYGFFTRAADQSGNVEPHKSTEERFAVLEPYVLDPDATLPVRFALHPAHPNPAARRASLGFDLPVASQVTVELFDASGRRVLHPLRAQPFAAGRHRATLDVTELPAGVYFVRMRAGSFEANRRLIVLE